MNENEGEIIHQGKSEERRVCPYVISNGIRLNVVLSALNVDYLYEYG